MVISGSNPCSALYGRHKHAPRNEPLQGPQAARVHLLGPATAGPNRQNHNASRHSLLGAGRPPLLCPPVPLCMFHSFIPRYSSPVCTAVCFFTSPRGVSQTRGMAGYRRTEGGAATESDQIVCLRRRGFWILIADGGCGQWARPIELRVDFITCVSPNARDKTDLG